MKYINEVYLDLYYPTQGESIAVKNGIYMKPVGIIRPLKTLKGPVKRESEWNTVALTFHPHNHSVKSIILQNFK